MEEDSEWRSLAIEKQLEFFETLGSRQYDEIEKLNLFLLRKKVGYATCGKPSELPNSSNYFIGYNKENLIHIKKICDKIIEKSDVDPIKFSCTILILYHEQSICETPIFRIVTSCGNIFIDVHSRVYTNWDCFMKENKLPECEYCFPENGEYNSDSEHHVCFALSPASSLLNKATDCLDTVGSVASVAAASVFTAGIFVTVAPVVATVAGATAIGTGVYSVSRNITSLYDRQKHDQSIGLSDKESRSAWLSLGSSALGVATTAAIGKATKIYNSGKSLSKLSIFGLHVMTASSLAFSGFGFVDTLIICADKYKKGMLTKKDIFDLSCELMFLFNAIASAKATTQLVNNMTVVAAETSTSQRKLTKTQKRNLRKRAAKRRAKGLSSSVKEEHINTYGLSSAMQLLLFEAVKAYAPRVEAILFKCQSIGHDIMSWKMLEMSNIEFLRNTSRNLVQLYNDHKDEIEETLKKVVKYFTSLIMDQIELLCRLFESASEELKSVFCTKVINLEDHIDVVTNEAEEDINELYDQLNITNNVLTENTVEDYENLDDNDLNSETKNLLSGCISVINASSWPCNDLNDFCEILEAVKYNFVSEFKEKISNYKKGLKAATVTCESSFDINKYHAALNIEGSVGQYFFNETLTGLSAKKTLYKIRDKCRKMESEMNARVTPIWEELTQGMYHYYVPICGVSLKKTDLFPILNSILETSLTNNNCTSLGNENIDKVLIIETTEKPDIHIVVYYDGVNEQNTASGVIFIIKEENTNKT